MTLSVYGYQQFAFLRYPKLTLPTDLDYTDIDDLHFVGIQLNPNLKQPLKLKGSTCLPHPPGVDGNNSSNQNVIQYDSMTCKVIYVPELRPSVKSSPTLDEQIFQNPDV